MAAGLGCDFGSARLKKVHEVASYQAPATLARIGTISAFTGPEPVRFRAMPWPLAPARDDQRRTSRFSPA